MKRIAIISLAVVLVLILVLGLALDRDNGDSNAGTESIVADFTSSPTSGSIPLEVQFTDKSTGDIAEWGWTFGDGTMSTEQNPTHTYTTVGEFSVILIVTNADGETDSKTATISTIAADTTTYTLSTSISPLDAGSVSPSSGNYQEGSEVTLTATPANGYVFDYWGGDASGSSPTVTVIMDSNKSLVANFKVAEPEPDEEQVILDENGIKVVVKGLELGDCSWGAQVLLYIENNTGQDFRIEAGNVSVNGFMISPMFYSDVLAGKKAFTSINFLESDLTDNGINVITTIELTFHVANLDTGATIYDSDVITISFE